MAHYTITYTCGHTDRVQVIGPHRTREQRLRYLESGLCADCYKTQAHAAAVVATAERDLPPFTAGTAAQQEWAIGVRIAQVNAIERAIAQIEQQTPANDPAALAALRATLHAVEAIIQETDARWWIEQRYETPEALIRQMQRRVAATPTAAEKSAQQAQKAAEEAQRMQVLGAATVRPDPALTAAVAEIAISANSVRIIFPEKRDDFRALVKKLGYTWREKYWLRAIDQRAGTPVDRAAEAGYTLLSAGFAICILDDALRSAAIAGTYAPECTRWITRSGAGPYAGWLCLAWSRKDDLYEAARRLPGSKYDAPHVVVPPTSYAEVQDFAERYGFQFSDRAQALVAAAAQAQQAALLLPPPPRKRASPAITVASPTPPVLAVPATVDIAPELVDA